MPADGISLPFTISGNVGSSRPEEHRDYKYPPPSKRPHFAARPLPPSADIGPGGQSVGQAGAILLRRSTSCWPASLSSLSNRLIVIHRSPA